jgi:hypothetical protein
MLWVLLLHGFGWLLLLLLLLLHMLLHAVGLLWLLPHMVAAHVLRHLTHLLACHRLLVQ